MKALISGVIGLTVGYLICNSSKPKREVKVNPSKTASKVLVKSADKYSKGSMTVIPNYFPSMTLRTLSSSENDFRKGNCANSSILA